jgi:methyltransferase (TIGR00027 family)
MREGSASLTATIVACARAAAGVDPVAERLVPRPLGAAARRVGGTRLGRLLSFGLVDHLALRTRAIDDVVVRERPAQLVVLGAGLDARAWRLGALADAIVFEVDHPATQAGKRDRIGDMPARARAVRFVGVDFEVDDLGERLAASGLDASTPTTWIWEGVTPYLTRGAIEATLDVVARRSALGSVLVATYVTPELTSIPRALRLLVAPAFRVLGEPLRGLVTPAEAEALVAARGFVVEGDSGEEELARRFSMPSPPVGVPERVLVARRARM